MNKIDKLRREMYKRFIEEGLSAGDASKAAGIAAGLAADYSQESYKEGNSNGYRDGYRDGKNSCNVLRGEFGDRIGHGRDGDW